MYIDIRVRSAVLKLKLKLKLKLIQSNAVLKQSGPWLVGKFLLNTFVNRETGLPLRSDCQWQPTGRHLGTGGR